jgi:hypothetical protein
MKNMAVPRKEAQGCSPSLSACESDMQGHEVEDATGPKRILSTRLQCC